MFVEESIFDFWLARCQEHNRRLQSRALDRIRPVVADLLKLVGISWDPEIEKILIVSALNFSRQFQKPYLSFFLDQLQRIYGLSYEEKKVMLQAIAGDKKFSDICMYKL